MVLLLQHDLARGGVVGTIRLVHSKLLLLLWVSRAMHRTEHALSKERVKGARKNNGQDHISASFMESYEERNARIL